MKDTVFQSILDKRVVLTHKLLLLETFYELYDRYKVDENTVVADDIVFNIHQFLWCLKLSSNSHGKDISIDSIKKTKRYLDEKEKRDNDYQMCCDCGDDIIDEDEFKEVEKSGNLEAEDIDIDSEHMSFEENI